MTSKRLPIAGFPHLALAAQDDQRLFARTLAALQKAGFTIETDKAVPPEGSTGTSIIMALAHAFQEAKGV